MSTLSDIFLNIELFEPKHVVCELLIVNQAVAVLVDRPIHIGDLVWIHMDFALEHTFGELFNLKFAAAVLIVQPETVYELSCGARLAEFTNNRVKTLTESLCVFFDICALNLSKLYLQQPLLLLFELGLALLSFDFVFGDSCWLGTRLCRYAGLGKHLILLSELL